MAAPPRSSPAVSLSLCLDLSCSRPYLIPLSAVCYFHGVCVSTRRRHAHTVWYADLTAAAANAATRQVTIRCTPTISISTLHCYLKRRYLATVWMLCFRDDYPETLSWNANAQIPCPAGQPTQAPSLPIVRTILWLRGESILQNHEVSCNVFPY